MRSYTNFFILIVLAVLVSSGFAQEGAGAADEAFPYLAEITGDNVYIRSGPGTNFYHCGKLDKGDKVKIVGKQFSWSRIVPPAGNFSWISMQYVSIDPAAPGVGTVTGDSVRVYAGSDFVKPMHSTTLQGKLNKGDKVKLLGEQMDDYYKITPPAFAYLWVSTNLTKQLPPVADVTPPVKTPVEPIVKPKVEPNETKVVVPSEVSPPMTKLEEYHALQKQLEAERAKPVDQQDYTSIKEAVTKIANDEGAGKAARYAQFLVRQIEGFELALEVAKTIRLQNEQLEKVKAGIEKARATRLAEVENLGRFAAVGEFQTYETYGPGHYRIIDESGKMVCYALPAGQASQMDLSELVGKRVGIVGTIEPHLPTKKAFVQFSEIVELK